MREALKVSVSGVRGVVGQSFTPRIATSFAQAFGTFVGEGPVVVGRDTRPTGKMIEYAVVTGLQSVGCQPVLAGIIPTPTLLYLAKHLGTRGGIAITASHNPSEWNALKFVDRSGLFLTEMRASELFDIYHQRDFPLVDETEISEVVHKKNPVTSHFRKIAEYVDAESIKDRSLKVAVDCCNGVGALYSAPFLKDYLGCDVVTIFDEPTGIFEREPEPLPANLTRLCETVVKEGCDIGFAQDPDGDRLAIVNEEGEPIGEDFTLAFAVRQVLSAHDQGPVAVNLSCSKGIEHVVREYGSELVRTKTGEINVSETILAIDGVAGGESNGGVIIPAIHPCRDSFAGMAIVLELMTQTRKRVSELQSEIPEFHVVKDKIEIETAQAPRILRAIRRKYERENINLLDGVYVDYGNRWFHVRRSNTEPVIRMMAEAPSQAEAEGMVAELRHEVDHAIKFSGKT